MKKGRIPTILGIIVLTAGLAAGVILTQYKQIFKLGAAGEISPKDIKISNVSSDSITISWLTDIQTTGFVKYGESQQNPDKIQEQEGGSPSLAHLVRITDLKPDVPYFFKINSEGKEFDSNGIAWKTQTGPPLSAPERAELISGNVLTATGAPSKNSLVYITIGGTILSTLTSENGSWIIPISSARNSDLSQYMVIDKANTLLEISVLAGPNEISSVQIYPQSAKPVPSIVLGQSYDFKSLPPAEEGNLPRADVTVPQQSTPSSGFNVANEIATPSAKTVTLDNIDEQEVVTSTRPEFLGGGPAGTTIEITIESDPISGKVVIPKTGEWNWNLPKNLPEGVHKITITWKDAAGITRTLTRNFIVQASEGPSFVSTPSATPTIKPTASPSLSPIPMSSATPSSSLRPSPSASTAATPFVTPSSGSLTPTLLLSIMGIGFVSFAFLLWKQSET